MTGRRSEKAHGLLYDKPASHRHPFQHDHHPLQFNIQHSKPAPQQRPLSSVPRRPNTTTSNPGRHPHQPIATPPPRRRNQTPIPCRSQLRREPPFIDDDRQEELLRMPLPPHPPPARALAHNLRRDRHARVPVRLGRELRALDVQANAAGRRPPHLREREEGARVVAAEGTDEHGGALRGVEVRPHLVQGRVAVWQQQVVAVDGLAAAAPAAGVGDEDVWRWRWR